MRIESAIFVAALCLVVSSPAPAFDEEDFPPAARADSDAAGTPAPARIAAPPRPAAGAAARVPTPDYLRLGEIPVDPALDLTTPSTDLWQRIRRGFALPDIDNALVREQEAWYAARPDYIARMVARSQRYLYFIVEELEKRGFPSELALLPMIESAYNPSAYSRSHAAGIWQFIPSTGKLYGLQQDFWQDERRDVTAATRAALDYLEKLYDQFGSWDLALAAYNWGEGAVARALAKNEAKGLRADYQNINMPRETRYYVPKLQAVKNIIAAPQRYGIELAAIPNRPYFTAVPMPRSIDVKLAARLAEMPIEEFLSLNPAHNRPVIRADGGRDLLLPADKANVFAANLLNHDKPLVSWQTYALKPGETLDKVAAKFGTSVAQLRQVNSLPAGRKQRLAVHTLLVPMRNLQGDGDLDGIGAMPMQAALPPARTGAARSHLVKQGETLFGIARRYGVTVQQVKSWNALASNSVAVGQRLVVGPSTANANARGARTAQARPAAGKRTAKLRTAAPKRVASGPAGKPTHIFVSYEPPRKR